MGEKMLHSKQNNWIITNLQTLGGIHSNVKRKLVLEGVELWNAIFCFKSTCYQKNWRRFQVWMWGATVTCSLTSSLVRLVESVINYEICGNTYEHNIVGKSPCGLYMRKLCLILLELSQRVSGHMQTREPVTYSALQRHSERSLATWEIHLRLLWETTGFFCSYVLLQVPQKGGGKGRWQNWLIMTVTHDNDADWLQSVAEGFMVLRDWVIKQLKLNMEESNVVHVRGSPELLGWVLALQNSFGSASLVVFIVFWLVIFPLMWVTF